MCASGGVLRRRVVVHAVHCESALTLTLCLNRQCEHFQIASFLENACRQVSFELEDTAVRGTALDHRSVFSN